MWTVDRNATYDRELRHPNGEKATVTMRPLDAGDRAEFNEVRLLAEGEGSVQTGKIQLLMVQRSLVRWTLKDDDGEPLPITIDIVRALEPDVFDQLYEHVSFGKPKDDVKKKVIDGLEVIEGTGGRVEETAEHDPTRAAASS